MKYAELKHKAEDCFRARPLFFIFLFFLAALAPAMALRDFTPGNELRYLNIADEAIREGHVFAFTNQGVPYADKPPLYIWLVMLSRLIFGQHCMFVLSLLSFLPAFGIILLMDRWLRMEGISGLTDRTAAAFMLWTSGLFLGISVFLRMDMLMCFFITAALYVFYKMYRGKGDNGKQSLLLPAFIFLALFTKGPVGLLVPPVAIVLFLLSEKQIKTLGKYLGWKTWGILLLLCAVWFTGVWIDGGREYLDNLLFHQTFDRAVNAFHHKEPFWYYACAIWYSLAPYSLLLLPVTAYSFFVKGGRTSTEKLFLCAFLGTFVMLSAFSSKLAIYIAPVFPFAVYFLPVFLKRSEWKKWMFALLAVPEAVFAAAGMALFILPSCLGRFPELAQYSFADSFPVYAAAFFLVAGNAAAICFLFRGNSWRKSVISCASALLAAVFSASFVLPEANDYIGYGNLCRTASEMLPENTVPSDGDVMTLFMFRPDNMDVYLGFDIKDYGNDVGAFLKDAPEGVLIVNTDRAGGSPELDAFLKGRPCAVSGPYSVYRLSY